MLGFFAGLGQQAVERRRVDALEGTEVGCGQAGAFEVAQQLGAVAAFLLGLLVLLLGGALLLAGFAVGFTLGLDGLFAAGLGDGAATGQLFGGHLAVLVGQFARGLAIEVETLGALRHGDQVGGGAGVATEEGRQGLLAEHARGTLLDVDLDAQLQGLGRAGEQGWEQLGQARAGGGGRGIGLGGGRVRRGAFGLLGSVRHRIRSGIGGRRCNFRG